MSSFSAAIHKFAGDCEKKQDQFVRKVCLDLTSKVVLGTPVDTGRARANWQASINQPTSGTLEKTDKGGGSTVAAASNTIKQATGNIFYLTNNLPYIYRLEFDGWSKKQAPYGWVRAAVTKVVRALR